MGLCRTTHAGGHRLNKKNTASFRPTLGERERERESERERERESIAVSTTRDTRQTDRQREHSCVDNERQTDR